MQRDFNSTHDRRSQRYPLDFMKNIFTFILLTIPITGVAQLAGATRSTSVRDDRRKPGSITLHVTAVRQEDDTDCDPSKCNSTKFTVEGYADDLHRNSRVLYLLTCNEYLVYEPNPHATAVCSKLHENTDYEANMFGDALSFWPQKSMSLHRFVSYIKSRPKDKLLSLSNSDA